MTGCISTIEHGSDVYHYAVELRDKVLRQPLGLSFSTRELLDEKNCIHLVYRDQDNIVACCVLKPEDKSTIRMRQLAVQSDWQRKGLGTQLVDQAECIARQQGFSNVILHARESVISFYCRLGYKEQGELFTEIGLPHRAMCKML